jgi:hypothetical protein
MFNLARFLNSKIGRFFISLMLGLGLATAFRKVCDDKSCLVFNGPVIDELTQKTYKFDEYCYKYELQPTICKNQKRTVKLDDSAAKTLQKEQTKEKKTSWIPFT